jgi:hypothetical protein
LCDAKIERPHRKRIAPAPKKTPPMGIGGVEEVFQGIESSFY